MAQVLQVVQLSLIAFVLGGDYTLVNLFNYPPNGPFPTIYENIREKKFFVAMGAWFLGNSISQTLTSTGAFEIAFDGQIVYSKLATGSHQLPTVNTIVHKMTQIDPQLSSHSRSHHDRLHHHQHHHQQQRQPQRKPQPPQHAKKPTVDEDRNNDVHELAYDDEDLDAPPTTGGVSQDDEDSYGFFGNRI